MSKIEPTNIQCPDCGETSSYEIYRTINATLDPKLKEAIFDGSLYWQVCPQCESGFDIESEILYNDMRQKICVWVKVPDESGVPRFDESVDSAAKLFHGYRTRLVSGRNELLEKIKLSDDGYDDLTVEIGKLFYSIANQLDLAGMFFYQGTEKGILGKKALVFTELSHAGDSRLHRLDYSQINKSATPVREQVLGALASRWGPWVWITRTTLLKALNDCGLARRS